MFDKPGSAGTSMPAEPARIEKPGDLKTAGAASASSVLSRAQRGGGMKAC
jgi:hypothetical protein